MSAHLSNSAPALIRTTICGKLQTTVSVMQKARSLFPVKTAEYLVEATGYSLRTCNAWLLGEAKIPGDALAALLRSEWGLEFLSAVMGESRSRWWRRLLQINLTATVLRRRAADKRLLQRALEADDELTATMARATTALCVQDEDFGSIFADGFRAMAGAPDRAMAAAPGKRGRS